MDHELIGVTERLARIEAALVALRGGAALTPGPCGRPIPTDLDAALYEAEAAELLGVSVRTLQARRVRGGGPAFHKDGRSVTYTRRTLLEHRRERLRRSTSDPGSPPSPRGSA
jgi:hypothetical protein